MIKLIRYVTLFAILWYVLAALLPQNIYFQYSRSLFLLDGSFFTEALSTVGGFANYCGAFVCQFMATEWVGALIFALLLTAVYALTEAVIRVFIKRNDYLNLALLPIAVQIALFAESQYSFTPLICYTITVGLLYLWSMLKGGWAMGLAAVATLGLYPLVGMWFLIFVAGVVLAGRSKLYWALVAVAAVMPALYAVPYFITMKAAYTALMDMQFAAAIVFIAITVTALKYLPAIGGKINVIVNSLTIVVIVVATSYIFVSKYDYREKVMLQIKRSMSERDWQRTLELGSTYPKTNILTTFAINTALLNMDQLPQRIFDYPQPFGVEGLFIGQHGNNRKNEYAHYIYASLGLYNEAHRQVWESLTTTGRNLSNIKALVLYNRLLDRENIAQKFNALLRKTLFEKGYYESIDMNSYVPLFTTEAPGSQGARFNNPQNIMADLSYMVTKGDSTLSKRVTDCFLVSLLLSNRVVEFGRHAELIKKHYPTAATLPPIYAQAFMLLKTRLSPQEFQALGFELPAQYEQLFNRYAKTYQASRGNANQLSEFTKTYYYYLNFLSPNGSKIITK